MDAERLLADLDDEQRAAAMRTAGPVVIHAGAGTGKTRVVTHRTAYAAATGAMDPGTALLVTFTKRAAGEMSERLGRMGVRGTTAATFHATAWRQLRHFWPRARGEELHVLDNPWRSVNPMVRALPGHYRFTATRDVLETFSWLKSRRVDPGRMEQTAEAAGRSLPLPPDLLAGLFRRYEEGKRRRNQVDFDDLVPFCLDLLHGHPEVLDQVRARYRWFSVDEFQDTNPLQYELLRLWLGDRQDLCVVGDENQTIYTFTGASSQYLARFGSDFPDAAAFDLTGNYRSTPQILQRANRLLTAGGLGGVRLRARRGEGVPPVIRRFDDEDAEAEGVARQVRRWVEQGVELGMIAVLVRLNADTPPMEAALARAGIAFRVRGRPFFERTEVREAVAALTRSPALEGESGIDWTDRVLSDELGYEPDAEPTTPEQRERQAALTALRQIVADLASEHGHGGVLDRLQQRRTAEGAAAGDAVEIATLHAAKGLEWDAVVISGLEEGRLPVQQSLKDAELLAEERRLLYVGITRARRHLLLSWAATRPVPGKPDRPRRPSRFLADLEPPPTRSGQSDGRGGRRSRPGGLPGGPSRARRQRGAGSDGPAGSDQALYEDLKQWRREESQQQGVPAYVVFPDSTLALIARDRPRTLAALGAVHGVGPAKLERYGAAVLAIVIATSDG